MAHLSPCSPRLKAFNSLMSRCLPFSSTSSCLRNWRRSDKKKILVPGAEFQQEVPDFFEQRLRQVRQFVRCKDSSSRRVSLVDHLVPLQGAGVALREAELAGLAGAAHDL